MDKNFISVYPDHTFKLHETSLEAFDRDVLFVAHYHWKESFNTFWQSRPKYSYTIWDANKNLVPLKVYNWEILNDSIRHYYYYMHRLDFKISDPLGEVRDIIFPSVESIDAIVDLWVYIKQFNGFDSWKHYELSLENIKLNEEIDRLNGIEPIIDLKLPGSGRGYDVK